MTSQDLTFTAEDELILGNARTGAKFTPLHHKAIGDRAFDAISFGDLIGTRLEDIHAEIRAMRALDVGYFHEHARNPESREQTTDLAVYSTVSQLIKDVDPAALISFGASRNGSEIAAAIKANGERARVAQSALNRNDGGADFVTSVAAIELQIVTDLERQGFLAVDPVRGQFEVLRDLRCYVPSGVEEGAALKVHSTAGGGNYGRSSAAVQFDTLRWSVDVRESLGLPFEVELVQAARSLALTHAIANLFPWGVRRIGRMNVTILFGFSPRLPFPKAYREFKAMVDRVKALATPVPGGPEDPLAVSVTVGAAVLPQHATDLIAPIDVGPLKGELAGPLDRLTAWASMPGSGVDILRVGLEDTPYLIDTAGRLMPATNPLLVERTRTRLDRLGVQLVTDPKRLRAFSEFRPT